MRASTYREAVSLLLLSILLGLSYNAVVGKGIFQAETGDRPGHPSTGVTPSSELISLEEAKQLFDDSSGMFVDTRHAYDYALSHIPGAINIPLKEAESLVTSFPAEKEKTLVVYCDGAECNSSLEVGATFITHGFTDVRIFFSGWSSWRDMGLPTEGTSK